MLLICAAVTPFTPEGDLDTDGLRPLFEAIRTDGISHVFVPGTTGEFTTLDDDERVAVLSAALEVFGPDGVFAHVGAASARQAVRLARAARAAGATRFAAITPYFVTAGPEATVAYYQALTEAVPDGQFYAYVFPQRATTDVTPETLARIAAIPGMAGAKLSGRSAEEIAPYLAAVPADFALFAGNDRELVALAGSGCAGIVSGVSSVFPEPFVSAVDAIDHGRDATGYRTAIDTAVDAVGAGDIALLKAGVALRGLPAGPTRVATEPPSAQATATLRRLFDDA